MKKYIIPMLIILLICQSCQDDPMKILDDIQYHERNILSIDLEFDELGLPVITRNENKAEVVVSYLEPASFEMNSVEILSIVVSYGATVSPGPGTKLDFDNPNRSTKVIVTPQVGDPLEWTIYLQEVPLGLEELKRTLLEDSYYWFEGISTEWKTVWDVKEFYVWDESGTVEGTAGDGLKVRPEWADDVLDNTLTMNDDGTFVFDPGPDGRIGGPPEGGYDILQLREGRWYYKDGILHFNDNYDASKNVEWPVNVDWGFMLKKIIPQEHWILFE